MLCHILWPLVAQANKHNALMLAHRVHKHVTKIFVVREDNSVLAHRPMNNIQISKLAFIILAYALHVKTHGPERPNNARRNVRVGQKLYIR